MGGEEVSEFWLRSAMWFAKDSKREGYLGMFLSWLYSSGELTATLKMTPKEYLRGVLDEADTGNFLQPWFCCCEITQTHLALWNLAAGPKPKFKSASPHCSRKDIFNARQL